MADMETRPIRPRPVALAIVNDESCILAMRWLRGHVEQQEQTSWRGRDIKANPLSHDGRERKNTSTKRDDDTVKDLARAHSFM